MNKDSEFGWGLCGEDTTSFSPTSSKLLTNPSSSTCNMHFKYMNSSSTNFLTSRRCLQMDSLSSHSQYYAPKLNGYQCSCIIWLQIRYSMLTSSIISSLLGRFAFILSIMALAFCTRVLYCQSLPLIEYFHELLIAFIYV